MTRDEAAFYTDLLPNGKARRFLFVMEAKSVITRPSGGQQLDGRGFYEITGLAWSGRGRITRVQVSTDEGRSWQDAELDGVVLPKAATRFRLPWRWNGEETTLQSRCTDETGYVQPTRDELVAVRGINASDPATTASSTGSFTRMAPYAMRELALSVLIACGLASVAFADDENPLALGRAPDPIDAQREDDVPSRRMASACQRHMAASARGGLSTRSNALRAMGLVAKA